MGLGIRNTDPRADYSGSGLGKYLTVADKIIANSGITNETNKTAIKTLYNGLKSNGLYDKLSTIKVMGLGSVFDSLDWKNPSLTASTRTVFNNDTSGAHTLNGFLPNATALRYGNSNFAWPLTATPLFHAHVFNSTSENTVSSNLLLAGLQNQSTYSSFYLGRNYINTTTGGVGPGGAPIAVNAPGGYDRSKIGLLSVTLQGSLSLYDTGVKIGTSTYTSASPIGRTGGANFGIGAYIQNTGSVTLYTEATLQFFAVGFTAWTDTDELNLNNLLVAFKASIV